MTFQFEDTRPSISDDDIIADLRRVAESMGSRTLTHREYQARGRYSQSVAKARFGTWNAALSAAGLDVGSRRDLPDDELFDNLRTVWIALGRQPRKSEMGPPLSPITHNPYVRRFGGWVSAMRAFAAAQSDDQPADFPAVPQPPNSNARQPSLRLRYLVMRRDRFCCTNCGRSPATDPGVVLHLDHVVPFSKGGKTDFANLHTTCADCNLGKSDIDP